MVAPLVACKQSRPEHLVSTYRISWRRTLVSRQGLNLVFWKRCGLQTQVKLYDGVMAVDRTDLRRSLFRLATERAGYFSAAQARELGYSYQAQAHHVEAGNWVRVERGLFRLTDWVTGVHDEFAMWTLWGK